MSLEIRKDLKRFLRHRKNCVILYAIVYCNTDVIKESLALKEKRIEQFLRISKLKKKIGYKNRDILEKLGYN